MTKEHEGRATDDASGPAQPTANLDDDSPAEDLPPEPPEEVPLEEAPLQVKELAAACVRAVASRYGVMLDFSPETLSLVDQWVRDARAEIAKSPEVLDLVQASAGAYLGEVMRLAYGGMWFAEGEHDGWRVDMTRVYLSTNPIGMVREALLLETQEGWHAYLEMDPAEREEVDRRLEALPKVEEDEYFAPTTRFDVVGIAVDALRAQMVAQGTGDVRFSEEDYRK